MVRHSFSGATKDSESSIYFRQYNGWEAQSVEQILTLIFEDGSEYVTKKEPDDAEQYMKSARDIELHDVEALDQ